MDASEDESTSTKWDVPEDKYLLESTRQRATRKLGEASERRFDARPIVINCSDDSALEDLVVAIKGDNGREPLFAEYCRAVDAAEDAESKSEAECGGMFERLLPKGQHRRYYTRRRRIQESVQIQRLTTSS